jgi:hypothetical protein
VKLYHGTTERLVPEILKSGIKPRGKSSGNWTHSVESNPDAVYLTNAYALYFAGNAAKEKERLAVVEIDSTKLNLFLLSPDEDFLEQASRKQNEPGLAPTNKSMKYRTRWYRRRLADFWTMWMSSLENLGTCTYRGIIPAAAITRIAYIDHETYMQLIMYGGIDPMINLMNYKLMGTRYRNSIKRLFHDSPLEDEPFGGMTHLPEDKRAEALAFQEGIWSKGIEVRELVSP